MKNIDQLEKYSWILYLGSLKPATKQIILNIK